MALTSNITQAAIARPYSTSTLRNYISAWEETYGELPRSRHDDSIQLVGPLLELFDSAYELRFIKQTTIRVRIEWALLDDHFALSRVVRAYSTLLGRADLVGVEHTVSHLQTHCLASLTSKLNQVIKRTSDISQLAERLNEEFSNLYGNLAAITEGHLHYAKQAAEAASSYVANLESDRQVSLELAEGYEGPSDSASGTE